MKRMGNHGGSIGSQHQIQGFGLGMGSSSGQNLMSESYQQGEVTRAGAKGLKCTVQRKAAS